jgi:hypothetical protein
MSDSSTPTETPRPVLPPTRARQGRNVRGMMGVLLVGTFLVIAAFAALMAYRAGDFAAANSNNGLANVNAGPAAARAEANAFHAPEPAPLNQEPGANQSTPPGPAQR